MEKQNPSWEEILKALENTSGHDLAIFFALYRVDENGKGSLAL
jgi:hypothetical protein